MGNDLAGVKEELDDVKFTVSHIENDHGQKLDLLVDGYMQKQNADKLDRIENEVTQHDDFIIHRVK